jgi:hypothetical protein
MKWSQLAQRALRTWVGRDTWHSGRGTDQGKFHSFVRALWEANHSTIDEKELAERILDQVRELGTEIEPTRQERVVRVHVKRAQCILRYLTDTSVDDTTIFG